jgi:hypothetical protein
MCPKEEDKNPKRTLTIGLINRINRITGTNSNETAVTRSTRRLEITDDSAIEFGLSDLRLGYPIG